ATRCRAIYSVRLFQWSGSLTCSPPPGRLPKPDSSLQAFPDSSGRNPTNGLIGLRQRGRRARSKSDHLVGVLRSSAMARLFGAIAAHSHAAPPPRMTLGCVEEKHGAARPLTLFYHGEVRVADQVGHGLGDGQEQGLRRAPVSAPSTMQTVGMLGLLTG